MSIKTKLERLERLVAVPNEPMPAYAVVGEDVVELLLPHGTRAELSRSEYDAADGPVITVEGRQFEVGKALILGAEDDTTQMEV